MKRSSVLYIRAEEEIAERIRTLAQINDRTITSMTNLVLRKGLGMPATQIVWEIDDDTTQA